MYHISRNNDRVIITSDEESYRFSTTQTIFDMADPEQLMPQDNIDLLNDQLNDGEPIGKVIERLVGWAQEEEYCRMAECHEYAHTLEADHH